MSSSLRVVVRHSGAERRWDASPAGDAVELQDSEGSAEIASSALATRLAAIVGLAPRPQRAEAELVFVDQERLEDHLATRERVAVTEAREQLALPAETPDDLARVLGALPGTVAGRWSVSAVGEGKAVPPTLEALDGGETGWWQLVRGEDSRVGIANSSARVLWAQLTNSTAWLTRP